MLVKGREERDSRVSDRQTDTQMQVACKAWPLNVTTTLLLLPGPAQSRTRHMVKASEPG